MQYRIRWYVYSMVSFLNKELLMVAQNTLENLSRREAAAYLGVSVSFLASDIVTKRHCIPYVKIGRRALYPRRLLDEYVRTRTVNVPEGPHDDMDVDLGRIPGGTGAGPTLHRN